MANAIELQDRAQAFPDVNATLRLVKAFMAIEDVEARTNLLSVVEAMARVSVGDDKAIGFKMQTLLSTKIEHSR